MNTQKLEQQLLSLDLTERIRILQLLADSLTVSCVSPLQVSNESELTRDRSPHHPLRKVSIAVPSDFDEPTTDLWDALEK